MTSSKNMDDKISKKQTKILTSKLHRECDELISKQDIIKLFIYNVKGKKFVKKE